MFRKNIFSELELEAQPVGWAVAFEMAIKAQYLGLKLGEVPIVSIDRLYGGESTFKLGPWVSEYSKWFAYGMSKRQLLNKNSAQQTQVKIPAYLR